MSARTGRFGFSGARKYDGNPILVPRGTSWESRAVFNPTVWTDGERVSMLYRAEGPADHPDRESCSCIGFATSDDGLHFVRNTGPVLEATEPFEIPGGCEDPRLARPAGEYCLTYTAYDGTTARLALATSEDLLHWKKHGPMLPDERWEAFFPNEEIRSCFPRGWSKSGAILPQQVNGLYWMFFGDTHIFVATSKDLRHWDVIEEPLLSPRPGFFDSRLVEPGPAPVLLPEGIWLGYNGADGDLRYAFGQCLLDPRDPRLVLARSETPLLEPTTVDETEGQVPNVVFGEGLVAFKGDWLLYYGMADSRVGVAFLDRVE